MGNLKRAKDPSPLKEKLGPVQTQKHTCSLSKIVCERGRELMENYKWQSNPWKLPVKK